MEKGKFGVNNVLVFAKGTYENYQITRVIRLQLDNETAIEIVRGDIYENERKQSTHKEGLFWENVYGQEFVREYTPQTFGSYQEIKTERGRRVGGTDSGAVDGISKGRENGAGNLNGDSDNGIKRRYALSAVDSDGKALSATQQDYFKDSQARDEKGFLMPVYNGVKIEKNTETLDYGYTYHFLEENLQNKDKPNRFGFFFTDNKETAEQYSTTWFYKTQTAGVGRVNNVYLNIKKPLDLRSLGLSCSEKEFFNLLEESGVITYRSRYKSDYKPVWRRFDNGGENLRAQIETAGYDGVIYHDWGETNASYVAFYPEQIKLTSNTSPTENADIRYALKGSDKVTTELPNGKTTIKDVITRKASATELATQVKDSSKEFTEGWQVSFTNAQAAVERVMKEAGIQDATAITNYVRAGKNAGMNALEVDGAQFTLDGETRVGDSWGKIWQPIYKANEKDGKTYADFQLYLLHWHNIDRMAVGKPVFHDNNTPVAEQVTAADSQTAIAELDKEYPQFRKIAEKVWKFNDNNLQLNVDSGKWSQEYADTLREMYPHYVPTGRVEYSGGVSVIQGRNNIRVNNDKKRAVGSGEQILPIDDMVAQQTIQKYQSARINKMFVDLLNGNSHEEFRVVSSEDISVDIDTDTLVKTYEDKAKNTHQITFYHDGKRITIETSRNFWKGIDAIQPSSNNEFNNGALRILAKVNSGFKKLVTSLNPFFS